MIFLLSTRFREGFTLIELLVSISIIGLLASIMMGSLNVARLKARDAKIKHQVVQLRNVIELDYLENNSSFVNLQNGVWYTSTAQCATGTFQGNYAARVRDICSAIVSASSNSNFASASFYVGNGVDLTTKFSIMAYLPGKQTFYCIGSSGISSDDTVQVTSWNRPGCWSNP